MKENSEAFSRTALLIGEAGVAALAQKRVAVFGVGGVGGYACEALARAGLGALDLYDHDRVAKSNLNRQVIALHSTLGQLKVEVMARRIADINPACKVAAHPVFYLPENAADYPLNGYDYVVDAMDTVSAKLELIGRAAAAGVPVISSMGTGNKLHPERLGVATIEQTSGCPLARVMRRELKKRGISGVKVVYSPECPARAGAGGDGRAEGEVDEAAVAGQGAPAAPPGPYEKPVPGSISFVPAAAGLLLAGAVVRDLLGLP